MDVTPMAIHIDLDGTICVGKHRTDCWTEEECLEALPKESMIEACERLYNAGHTIIIYTARREPLRAATLYWLKKHNVKYHALDLGNKAGSDLFVDDRAMHSDDFIKVFGPLCKTNKKPLDQYELYSEAARSIPEASE